MREDSMAWQRAEVQLEHLLAHTSRRRCEWRLIGETWYVSVLTEGEYVSSGGSILTQGSGRTRDSAAAAAINNLIPPGRLR
jgi:hypothetical protein